MGSGRHELVTGPLRTVRASIPVPRTSALGIMPSTAQDRDIATALSAPGGIGNLRPRPGVSLHFLDDESVLFDAATCRVYATNKAATLIWCCLEDEMPPETIAARLAAAGLPPRDAAEHLIRIVREWQGLGLIGAKLSGAMPARPPDPARWQRTVNDARPRLRARPNLSGDVLRGRLLDADIEIRFATPAWCERLRPMLAPLNVGEAMDEGAQGPAHVLELAAGEGLSWYADGQCVAQDLAPDQVAPVLKSTLVELALQTSRDFGALHAAAVGRAGKCVLLPGQSGSGKSTLAASLLADGYDFLGDDTIVLDRTALAVRPLPFPICVKSGAWDVVAQRFATLRRQPIHRRPDGKRVRYLYGGGASGNGPIGPRYDVTAIVFPTWTKGAATALVTLPRPQALRTLLAGFCPLGDGLAATDIARLVTWIARLDCYELRFSALDDAIARLEGLLP